MLEWLLPLLTPHRHLTRHRQGHQVLVTRSARGSTLLHLYEP